MAQRAATKRLFAGNIPRANLEKERRTMTDREIDIEAVNKRGAGYLPGELGMEFLEARKGYVRARLAVAKRLLAPNGYLHAASVIALADLVVRF
jgi:acyl-coenzyme A thioesterase PaaI-like protein